MSIVHSTGSGVSPDTSLSFALASSPGDLTTFFLTLNLASDFDNIWSAWDWSGCSAAFRGTFGAVNEVLLLLQEVRHGIDDPRYVLPAEIWQLIRACRHELCTLDEWMISNAPDFAGDPRGWSDTYIPITNVFSYGHQLIRSQTIADHYKDTNINLDVMSRLQHALVQSSKHVDRHLETSRARIRYRLEKIALQLGSLSRDSRCRIWHLYGGALQGNHKPWDEIAEVLSLPHKGDPVNPDDPWDVDYKHTDVVRDIVRKEILTALETVMKTDPICDAPYEYTPLERPHEQIRVISDVQRRPSGELQLQLHVKDLISSDDAEFEAPEFTALSYTWGKPGQIFYVWVGDRRFPIQRNAFTFLQHYITHFAHNDLYDDPTRSKLDPTKVHRPIWIDAICINQKDAREKGQQVSIMREIYQKAYRVSVWLDGCSDDKAFRTLYNRHLQSVGHRDGPLLDDVRDCTETPNFEAWLLGECFSCGKQIGTLDYDHTTLKIWPSIISHPYWTRIWIIQELSLAQSRPEIILWDTSISAQLVNETKVSKYDFDNLRVESMIPMSHGPSTLSHLLGKFSHRGRTDARDLVYALLSMTPYAGTFKVDYNEGAAGLICRVLPLLLQERDDGRPTSTILEEDSLVKLIKALALYSTTQLLDVCKALPTEHAVALREPFYRVGARKLAVLSLIDLSITSTTFSNDSVDYESVNPSQTALITSARTSRYNCLEYYMGFGTFTEPDKTTDAAGCAIVFKLHDLPIAHDDPCSFGIMMAARGDEVEVLCYFYHGHLSPIPSDIKARWEDHLRSEGKTWPRIWCEAAWENQDEFTLPCSMLDAAHLSDVVDMFVTAGKEEKEEERDMYPLVDSPTLPDAVRKMCPPTAPLSTLPTQSSESASHGDLTVSLRPRHE